MSNVFKSLVLRSYAIAHIVKQRINVIFPLTCEGYSFPKVEQ